MDIRLKLILFVTALAFQCFAQLDDSKFEDLVQKADRPTVQEVLADLKVKPGQAIYEPASNKDEKRLKELKESILRDLPKLAVELEYFYPNGRYAFLGRDASGAADVLEAFYLSIGQKDRVIRLRSSGDSLAGEEFYKNPEQIMADFLRTNGAPLDSRDLESERPFVIVDATSLGPTSQSTRLASAGIEALKARGYKVEQIYPKFAVADISKRNFAEFKNRKELLRRQMDNLDYYGRRTIFGDSILGSLAKSFAYDAIQPLWHKTFKKLRYVGDQKVETVPGSLLSEEARRETIRTILMINQLVRDREVISAVQKAAAKREISFYSKYNLDAAKKRIKVQSEPKVKSAVALYKEMYDRLRFANGTILMSTGLSVFDLLTTSQKNYREEKYFPYAYISFLLTAYKEQKISFIELSVALGQAVDLQILSGNSKSELADYVLKKAKENPDFKLAIERAEFINSPQEYIRNLIEKRDIKKIVTLYKAHAIEPIAEPKNNAGTDKTFGDVILREIRNHQYLEDFFVSIEDAELFDLQEQIVKNIDTDSVTRMADILLKLPQSARRELLINEFLRNPVVPRWSTTLGIMWSELMKAADLDTLKGLTSFFNYADTFETYNNPKLKLLSKAMKYGLQGKRNQILEEGYIQLLRGSPYSCKNIVRSVKAIFGSK